MPNPPITILCSGVALGVYIPAIHLTHRLRNLGRHLDVVVLESLFTPDKREKIKVNKQAFHQNFAVALMGQKMARDVEPNLDGSLVKALFDQWRHESRTRFIVFSGFWMNLLEQYRTRFAPTLQADLVHMDAAVSASWKNFFRHRPTCDGYLDLWLYRRESGKVFYQLPMNCPPLAPYAARPDRYLIHGGGWGMGTYQGKIPELTEHRIPLDIIAYNAEEADDLQRLGPEYRIFMMDPSWFPWYTDNDGIHGFPPFGRVIQGKITIFSNPSETHALLALIGQNKGIISKPGGATLADSLATSTPLIMLEPFGDYEKENAALWEELGFGIPYPRWRESGYDPTILAPLHANLLAAKSTLPEYIPDNALNTGKLFCNR